MTDAKKWDHIELLVRRAQRRDEEAFRALLEQHRDAVVSTLFACGVRCRETARDLAQDRFDEAKLNKVVFSTCLATDMAGFSTIDLARPSASNSTTDRWT